MKLATWCSGIGAPEMAAVGLGFSPHSMAEIDPFASAVLAERWPGVPNLGDLTAGDFLSRFLALGIPDGIMAGTPCQAFSIAGLRKGMKDKRGNLTLVALEHLNGIAESAHLLGRPGPTFIWENVPGALSDKTNAFGCLLAGLVGHDSPIKAPSGGGWADAGMVVGPARRAAWRVLDAQYFGLAQRRARVFLVASPPDGTDPAEILFERAGLHRHPPSRRGAQEKAARAATEGAHADGPGVALSHWDGDFPHPTLNQSAATSGGVGASNQEIFSQRGAYLVPGPPQGAAAFGGNNTSGPIDVTPSLLAQPGSGWKGDFDTETFIVQCVTGERTHALTAEGMDASEDGTGRGTPIIAEPQAPLAFAHQQGGNINLHVSYDIGLTLQRSQVQAVAVEGAPVFAIQENANAESLTRGPSGMGVREDVAFTLLARNKVKAVAFENTGQGWWNPAEAAAPIRDMSAGGGSREATVLVEGADPIPLDTRQISRGEQLGSTGTGIGEAGEPSYTLAAHHTPAIAFSAKDHGADASPDLAPTLRAMGHDGSHANGGGQLAVALPGPAPTEALHFNAYQRTIGEVASPLTAGDERKLEVGVLEPGAFVPPLATTLRARDGAKGVDSDATDTLIAFTQNQREEVREPDVAGALAAEPGMKQQTYLAISGPLMANGKAAGSATQQDAEQGMLVPYRAPGSAVWHVRRLTPMECERLQGFPDGFTRIAYRGKPPEACPDGPRYKALGNSMAVPVVRWILMRYAATVAAS